MQATQLPTPSAKLSWKRIWIVLATSAAYIALFLFFYPRFGAAMISLSVFPVIAAGWLIGLRAGLLLAGVALPLHVLLLNAAGADGWQMAIYRGWSGHLVLVLMGASVGWLSELLAKVRQQSVQLTDESEALQREVNERKRVAAALQDAKESAEAANVAKTEFVSLVSHELQTPLTYIKGYADLLRDSAAGPVTETQADYLNIIQANVDRMARLIADLAEVSFIEAGHLRLELAPLSINEVIAEVTHSTQGQLTAKEQKLIVLAAANLPLVSGDRSRLIQVLTNLVNNAHKYTPAGGQITIRAEKTNGPDGPSFVRVTVQDTGLGIKAEEQAKVFQKFFRSSDSETRRAPGTGLGLNIARNLIDRHGGRIWLESEYRQGTAFHFTVPISTQEERPGSGNEEMAKIGPRPFTP
jgi:signal transduction histidine kinase